MDHLNNRDFKFRHTIPDYGIKAHQAPMLFALMTKLTTVIQINSVLVIIMSMSIPLVIGLQLSSYIIVLLAVLIGFLIGISFTVVLVQKYIVKLLNEVK